MLDAMYVTFIFIAALIASAPSLAYLLLIWLSDVFEREPLVKVLAVFLVGAAVAVVAYYAEGFLFEPLSSAGVTDTARAVYIGPVLEELLKALPLVYLWRKMQLHDALCGILFAAAVALGFAVAENFMYFTAVGASLQLERTFLETVFSRTLNSGWIHVLSTSMIGLSLGGLSFVRTWAGKVGTVLLAFAAGALLHISFNLMQLTAPAMTGMLIGVLFIVFASAIGITLMKESAIVGEELLALGLPRRTAAAASSVDARLLRFFEVWFKRGFAEALLGEAYFTNLSEIALRRRSASFSQKKAGREELRRLAKEVEETHKLRRAAAESIRIYEGNA